ncbi:hypothetical protein [Chryseobacterium luquanense]|uniref:Lipoprotein n=1 Tax=Chryseobacterium luquanense TaxID=2983766 RepID=A0ABT3Y1R8_9FLAO|nr:hypothetical protein [Chryseobacterium luquanense]MCX8532080.1 hypothetical protein [Chryseobacterium luquanense]
MDKTAIIKNMVLIVWVLFPLSLINCHKIKKENEDCYFIFKKESIKDLILLHGNNKNDTLLFVIRQKKIKANSNYECIQVNSNMSKIDHIKLDGELVYFNYKIKVAGKDLKINVGSTSPGSQKIINSYSSFPYFIK